MSKRNIDNIFKVMSGMFPGAKCELNYRNLYELTVSVVLSAQTTDVRVNMVTADLFKRYPLASDLAVAEQKEVEAIIKSIGLYQTKAKNIIGMARGILENNNEVPNTFEELIKLPGVGRKSANVVLSEGYRVPRIAVDTHVERVSKRLGIASPKATPLQVEEALMAGLDPKDYHQAHHTFIFFGRYHCLARKPHCENCPFSGSCEYFKDPKRF